ncbi:nuclear transport factor 2 family protein [Occallatibacter savannae]|uniref:nuclear transport factor 2 family protein n=1 Tax=Occallatibacter savannae TaxID=1002691 RepID=UPI0013A52B88|nr:nuclear transport factor 2 family protein [Occallatibacter savannae]
MLIAANSSGADTLADKKEILRLEEVQAKAWLKHDWATISMMVADDFQYWSFKGIRRNKDDLKRTLEQSGEGDTKIEDPEVRVYGNAAIFTARILDTEKLPNGQTHAEKTCVTDVFIRRAGKWRLVASQETPVAEGK